MADRDAALPDGAGPIRTIALIGNPNCGKTTLFNALTGLRQKVGNYPGVTVERKEGVAYSQHGQPLRVIDLPGTYSLQPRSPDEKILVDVIFGRIPREKSPDAIVCVVDASNLERNLYMVSQALELGLPLVVALNMMDVARGRGMRIDADRLSRTLKVPVIPVEAVRGKGLVELRLEMARKDLSVPRGKVPFPELINQAVEELAPLFRHSREADISMSQAEARLYLGMEDGQAIEATAGPAATRIRLWRQRLDRQIPGWRSGLITARYAFIGDLIRECLHRFNPNKPSMTERIDRVLLNPVAGLLTLSAIMGLVFYSIFKLAVPFMDAIDSTIGWIGERVAMSMPDGAVEGLIVDGVIAGVGGVVIFLPQILMLFFFIGLLESTGYMARAAFILDRLMSKVGLHGRSFVPLLSSYACAVPGIMATRTIESLKDRMVTIMVAPFMTCSARLPVYLVLIAALMPQDQYGAGSQAGMLFLLYALGTIGALAFGLIFKKTLMRGATPTMVMELPPYRMPQLKSILLELLDRSIIFLRRAGTIIFALSIVLWFSMNYPRNSDEERVSPPVNMQISDGHQEVDDPSEGTELAGSFAGKLGHLLEPLFRPLGYDWKITVGLIASFAAREVFVSTMAIIYSVEDEEDTGSLVEVMRSQKRSDGSMVYTPLTCLSLMVFFVYALQCLSTVAVVRRETNSWRWPLFQLAYMLAVAWVGSFLVFQGGRLLGFS